MKVGEPNYPVAAAERGRRVPGEDGHYRPFIEVYGTSMTEEHRPSLQTRKGRQKSLPFSASVQHVKNVDMMIQCEV